MGDANQQTRRVKLLDFCHVFITTAEVAEDSHGRVPEVIQWNGMLFVWNDDFVEYQRVSICDRVVPVASPVAELLFVVGQFREIVEVRLCDNRDERYLAALSALDLAIKRCKIEGAT